MKEKIKIWKVVLISIITFLVLSIITLILYFGYCLYLFHVDGLSEGTPMSSDEIQKLVQSINSKTNYYYQYDKYKANGINSENNLKIEVYRKDNKFKVLQNGELYAWIDFDTGERILFVKNSFEGDVAVISQVSNNEVTDEINWRTYSLLQYEYIDENRKFEYLGDKKVKDTDCIVIRTYVENPSNIITKFLSKTFASIDYVDKETGIVLLEEDCYTVGLLPKKVTRNIAFSSENPSDIYKIDVVTDEDIARPDLSSYKVINK